MTGHRLALFLTLLLVGFSSLSAQKSSHVKSLERRRKALTEEIKRTTILLNKTSQSTASSLKKLQLLNSKIDAQRKVIETLGGEIAAADSSLLRIGVQLDSLQKKLDTRQEYYVRSVRAMQNRKFGQEYLLFILSSKHFDQGLRRMRYLKQYASWQRREAEKLREISAEITSKKREIQSQKDQKKALLSSREKEKVDLQRSEEQSRKQIQDLQAKKKELEQVLIRKRKKEQDLNKQIERQIAKEIEESKARAKREEEARRLAQKKRDQREQPSSLPSTSRPETRGGYAMNEGERRLSGSFEANRGKLPAPISGSYTTVGQFGEHAHQSLSHVRVNSSGVDLQGEPSATARAVYEGEVTKIFVVEGYNNTIIIRHGNYLTVYSNLTSVFVKSGDKVKTGQPIGKVYSDPEMGGATFLHFQLWKERVKLNPSGWFR